jgi:murein DD-endopeptidase MepM/ murein hydrolase activator NlpD
MVYKKILCGIATIILLPVYSLTAQIFTPKNYPKGYFAWPVGAKVAIAANFGELRPNHYHMGLDCKTEKKQNMPILAAADGYIARIKIEPYGFGRAIYINHPNGLTTLYAHLNDFYPELEAYIKKEQYRIKSWKGIFDIPAGTLPVTKGKFIAYSGNTGGSQGPHLHFEIRDTKTDKVLNPLLFGFAIPDNVPPDVLRLAMYDRCISVYEQSPKFLTLKKINGVYTTTQALVTANTDKLSFAITAYDRYTGSTNQNGIYEAGLYDNEQPVVGFQLDSISYDETRYLNAHIDHKLRSSGGPFIQHLSRLPGYTISPYKEIGGDGVISIDDDSVHQIKIEVKDADGNTSIIKFAVQRGPVKADKPAVDSLGMFRQRNFHPGFVNIFENSNISFYLPENALYDSIRFTYREVITKTGPAIFQLHNGNIPVHSYFPVKIKGPANNPYYNKMVMFQYWNGKTNYARADPEGDWYKARFRSFGNFTLLTDTMAPTVAPVGFRDGMNCAKLKRLAFVILDNTEELINFTATLDGNWLRFSNDKGRTFIYDFDENCAPGEHELKISVEDCVGNRTERTYHFTR